LVKLRVHTVNPPEVQGLDPNDPDDRLVASAIYYESRYGKKPMIVTGDFGVRFTAEAHEFPLLILPDNLRLPDEPDEKDEELRKLKVENEKLRVQTPRLRLRYTDGKPVLAVRIFHEGDMSDEKILDLAYDAVDEHDTDGWSDKAVSDLVSRVQRKLYALRTWNKTDRYTFPLQLELANEGAAPAVDVDVAVRVPTHFTLLLRRDKRPEVPPGLVPESSIRPYSDEWDTSAPQWSKVSDVEAQYKIERVAQGDVVKPPPLFLRLKDRDNLQGFQIEARVRAGNVPGVDEMELSVTLR
jgi:hypothetical protein